MHSRRAPRHVVRGSFDFTLRPRLQYPPNRRAVSTHPLTVLSPNEQRPSATIASWPNRPPKKLRIFTTFHAALRAHIPHRDTQAHSARATLRRQTDSPSPRRTQTAVARKAPGKRKPSHSHSHSQATEPRRLAKVHTPNPSAPPCSGLSTQTLDHRTRPKRVRRGMRNPIAPDADPLVHASPQPSPAAVNHSAMAQNPRGISSDTTANL